MIVRMRVKQVSSYGRGTQGVRLVSLAGGDALVSVAKLAERVEEGERGPGIAAVPPPPEPGDEPPGAEDIDDEDLDAAENGAAGEDDQED
jgi:hypothetical protein